MFGNVKIKMLDPKNEGGGEIFVDARFGSHMPKSFRPLLSWNIIEWNNLLTKHTNFCKRYDW